MRDVEVRYAVRDGKRLAFEVFGGGPCDVAVLQSACPIDLMWDLPQLASFMERLGGFARVIAFDLRGQGASDPIPDFGAATVEMHADDLLAVLDAAGSELPVADPGASTPVGSAVLETVSYVALALQWPG